MDIACSSDGYCSEFGILLFKHGILENRVGFRYWGTQLSFTTQSSGTLERGRCGQQSMPKSNNIVENVCFDLRLGTDRFT